MFSKLRTHSWFSKHSTRGFSLVELLVSVAIIAIISGIVLTRYSAFDSTTVLKNESYEIALLLRESQVKAVSVSRNESGNFNQPYGMSFEAESTSYETFYGSGTVIETYALHSGLEIESICYTTGGSCTSTDSLDVSFLRPEFNAIFDAEGAPDNDAITQTQIIVGSISGDESYTVEISKLGQISVYRTP